MTSSNCYYGKIDMDVWLQPDWSVVTESVWNPLMHRRIDEDKAKAAREDMIKNKVIYGHSVPYRNMCRFQSGVSVMLISKS